MFKYLLANVDFSTFGVSQAMMSQDISLFKGKCRDMSRHLNYFFRQMSFSDVATSIPRASLRRRGRRHCGGEESVRPHRLEPRLRCGVDHAALDFLLQARGRSDTIRVCDECARVVPTSSARRVCRW